MNSLYQPGAWHGMLREVFLSLSVTVHTPSMHFEGAVLAAVPFTASERLWLMLDFIKIKLSMLFLDFP